MRSNYPVIPADILCRELFKVLVHFVLLLFVADDQMELQSEEEGRNMCVGFAQLDDRSRESFPVFPTVQEMKKIVRQMSTPSIVGPTVFFGDFVNKIASVLFKHGNYSHDVVYDFRLRASNIVSLYIQSVANEKDKEKQGTVLEVFWRRIFGGCAFIVPLFADVFSGALGSTKQHVGFIKPRSTSTVICFPFQSTICFLIWKKKIQTATTCSEQSLPRKRKLTFPKLLKKFLKFPRLYWSVLMKRSKTTLNDILAFLSFVPFLIIWVDPLLVGCGLIVFVVPRYAESSFKNTLVEVDDEHLSTWLSEKSNDEDGVIKDLLEKKRRRKSTICDNIFGAILAEKEVCSRDGK